ncbi:MAG: AAA family ATPase [Planctomycetes bacterium]|nr:AAA family ATPase [Planctomycetota bacterium]
MAIGARYLTAQVQADLARKMVFVAGPRQVGKTTLARALPGGNRGYLNWDIGEDRARILAREVPSSKLWAFDETHKYKSWRGDLKGLYDGRRAGQRILVTGNARLDLYRHGGDSLQGCSPNAASGIQALQKAILHCSGFDLYPDRQCATHTIAEGPF